MAERVTAGSAAERAAAVCNKSGFATKVWDLQCVISRPVMKVSPGNLLKGDSSISSSVGGAFCPDPKVGAISRRQPWDSTVVLRPSGQYTGLNTIKKKKSNLFGILCFIISRKVKTQLKCKKTCATYREWKSWLKTQHSKNEDHSIWSHHFTAKRWENNGNSGRFSFWGLQNHCRWWLQPWN